MTISATEGIACLWAVWSFFVMVVQSIGVCRIFRDYSAPPRRAAVEALPLAAVPHVTVIRPVKGLEPELYACLASTFRQTYPRARFAVHLCVEDRADPALPVLARVCRDHPDVDARIYVEAEDPCLHQAADHLGPNPKIRNMSRAYREARGDIVWIVDCNVWVAPGVAGRMVDKLCGIRAGGATATPYKFVHQLPLVVDVTGEEEEEPEPEATTTATMHFSASPSTTSSTSSSTSPSFGGRLDEMFMATSHAKFYCAINTVGIAPCIVGKSNMFRRSHLDRLTAARRAGCTAPAISAHALDSVDMAAATGRGLDYFSRYICEDHLLGDLLWRARLPGFRNHGLAAGDLALQPMAATSVGAYAARRARWLRVRKWTVLLATLLEPGVESLLCCFYAACAVTTLVPGFVADNGASSAWWATALGIVPTWAATARGWLVGVAVWGAIDWLTYRRLQACRCIAVDADTPAFAYGRGRSSSSSSTGAGVVLGGGRPARPFSAWLAAWLGREGLALPIWTWAVLLGTTVDWRGKQFRVRMDMRVVEVDGQGRPVPSPGPVGAGAGGGGGGSSSSKARVD